MALVKVLEFSLRFFGVVNHGSFFVQISLYTLYTSLYIIIKHPVVLCSILKDAYYIFLITIRYAIFLDN